MKSIYLFIPLILLVCVTCHAQSLQEPKNLVSDLQSILKDSPLRFYRGSLGWSEELGTRESHDKVFSGSAYIVFDDPAGTTSADEFMAERVCNGFQKLYHLEGTGGGGGSNHRSPTQSPQSGEAYFEWINDHDTPPDQAEKISLRVQVVALRESQIGFIFTFVHVPAAIKPAA